MVATAAPAIDQPLRGRTIVVTRPAAQADAMVAAIEAAGGSAPRQAKTSSYRQHDHFALVPPPPLVRK